MKLRYIIALLLLSGLIIPAVGYATVFSGYSSAIFSGANPTAGRTFTGLGTSEFTNGNPTDGVNPNKLSFDSAPFLVDGDKPFCVSEFHYYNGVTEMGTNVETVEVDLGVVFNGPVAVIVVLDFWLQFDVTPNQQVPDDADALHVHDIASKIKFDVYGTDYNLELLGFSDDGGKTFISTFILDERASLESDLYARITPVPEPCTIMLLTVGAMILRRRKVNR